MATAKKITLESAEPAEETVSVDDEGFVEKVTAIVRDILKTERPSESAEPTGEPEKRLSVRDEEDRTRSIVAEAIDKFKGESKSEPKSETKSEPERVPGASTTRWVEKVLWGKE